jgi:hypothetical protein
MPDAFKTIGAIGKQEKMNGYSFVDYVACYSGLNTAKIRPSRKPL